jgi:hypothetical protein
LNFALSSLEEKPINKPPLFILFTLFTFICSATGFIAEFTSDLVRLTVWTIFFGLMRTAGSVLFFKLSEYVLETD